MARSRHLNNLEREIRVLRTQFLPDPFDPLGKYPNSDHVQAHTRAFLVLSHAEIESYFEIWAKEIARAAEQVWTSSSRVTAPLAFLLATLADRIQVPETMSGNSDSPRRLAEVSTKLFHKYYKRIKDNNGIKEKNVLDLFAPLGIPATAFGATLLPNLDSLGALRGTHAHHSAKAVPSAVDPETEYKRVMDVVTELTSMDDWLGKCKQRIR